MVEFSKSNKIPVSFSWSGGKDSAFALWQLQKDQRYEVVRLHTTLGEQTQQVGMHGTSVDLIEAQANAIGLPLDKIFYRASGDNQAYEKAVNSYLDILEKMGIRHLAYGDIFLEDLRKYREDKLAERGFEALFPLWASDTEVLSKNFIEAGFKTSICAADADLISKEWVGKDFDFTFLKSLSTQVDPCGENGEFHSFCYAGPIFSHSLVVKLQEVISQTYEIPLENGEKDKKMYWFADLWIS
ncbi:diphthine--ammonia ligase [Algoriphagus sp.]|uniref:Dph6-related ATP pyrophosphatase n=1 Tax=Algoriphagus sp. TaxID=1872435 RepID=UPI00391A4378